MKVLLLVVIVASANLIAGCRNIEKQLLARLTTDTFQMQGLMAVIREHFRNEWAKNPRVPMNPNYRNAMDKTTCQSYGEQLVTKLSMDLFLMQTMQAAIQKLLREVSIGKPYGTELENSRRVMLKTAFTMREAGNLLFSIKGVECNNDGDKKNWLNLRREPMKWTRRSNSPDFDWEKNFYKALSRALREEYRDEKLIQENVHDGFVPATMVKQH